jgi:hypothetical protein
VIFKLKANLVWEFLKDGYTGGKGNKLQNSDKSKLVFSEDATFHTFAILNRHKFSF